MTNAQEATPVVYKGLEFPKLPYASHWVEVNGVKIHYIDVGDPKADPILFLHGIPTWLYIWRNVIPVVQPAGRVIAMDFPGFGRSDKVTNVKPETAYDFASQRVYLEGFINVLQLKKITLVVQDIGSVVGFDYASNHEDNIKGIVFMEAGIPPYFPPSPAAMKTMPQQLAEFFSLMNTPGIGEEALLNQDMFIESVLPGNVVRKLTQEELDAYRAPFPTPNDRLSILWGGPRNLANPKSVEIMAHYVAWMSKTKVPMLQLYVEPGSISPKGSVDWAKANIKNLSQVFLGKGTHFIQEDYPQEIGKAIVEWMTRVLKTQ